MKILFVTQYFYPEIFRGNDIAFDLANKGESVTVITAVPNYPSGSFFKGYGIFRRRKEIINNVEIIRIPVIPRGRGGALQLFLNYFSFALFSSIYCFFLALRKKFNCIFVQQLSPVTLVLPAIVFKKIQKIPLYLWVLDLWPESLTSAGGVKNRIILSFFENIVKAAYRNADKILISSKGFEKSIIEKGDFKKKIIYFPNWAEDVFNETKEIDIPELPRGFLIMFAGNIGEAQNFENVLKTALLLKENKEIKFIIIGDGRKKDWISKFILDNNLNNTVFLLGRFPIEAMPSFFNEASVMLLPLKDELIFNLTVPAKLQAYMASSKPVLGMLNGEGAKLIMDAGCGYSVEADNYVGLAEKIEELSNLPKSELLKIGANGRSYCDEFFNKKKSLSHLYELIKKDS